MNKLAGFILLLATVTAKELCAQDAIAVAKTATSPAIKTEKKAKEKIESEKPAANKLPGAETQSNEPVTTEIYADEAFFDSNKSMGIFSGRVKVTDPRFNLQSDKLTVFITKGQSQSLEKAIAEGNVGLVREHPDRSGGPANHAVGCDG